jgi:glyoxylase-like metal-dependent hydrolase (beta-lactamase superfamily II)
MKITQRIPVTLIGLVFSLSLFAQVSKPSLTISHLTGDFYVYTTYRSLSGTPYPSNSMYLVTCNGVVMLDTPWDTTQFQPLLDSIEKRHQKKVILCIATHFHDDRTAGLDFLRQKGIKTYTSKLTYELCKEHNEKQAEYYFTKDTTFKICNYSVQTYYPGEGHTKDNIVIWFDKDKILYGGCLVKSTESNGLGNIEDANIPAWSTSISNIMDRFSKPKYVIPGHLDWDNNKSLQHTLSLLKRYYRKNKI